jgi:acetyl esterase
MAVNEQDVSYARSGDETLMARVYHDHVSSRGHAIVSVHGGTWTKNDRTSAHVLDRGLARAGLTVFALDFRQGPQHKFPAATQDIIAGIRYVRANASRFGVNPDTIGIVGSSSGGQSVLLTSLTPGSAEHEGTDLIDEDGQPVSANHIDSAIAYTLALWPVTNPAYRYQYAQEVGRTDLVAGHRAYFRDENDMHTASIQRVLDDGEASALPPLWVVQAGADENVPQAMTLDFLRALQARGAPFEYVFYPGQPHALTRDDTPMASRCIADAVAFIDRQLAGNG